MINEREMGREIDRTQFNENYLRRLEEVETEDFSLDFRHDEIDAVKAHLRGDPDAARLLGAFGLGVDEDGGLVALEQ